MNNHNPENASPERVADMVAQELDADVILYSGSIERHMDTRLIDACASRRRRKNALLMLVTMGGDPHVAYRIARCFQDNYERFILYVSGYCKSAGTLVALGAHELIISDHGELGPLDVQMTKKDEIWEMQSGLTVMDALRALKNNAFRAYHEFFEDLMDKGGGSISLKTASQIATDMTTGMFAPIYGQLNPLHIGEAGRAMDIAGHYGKRLLTKSENIEPAALNHIMSAYPDHGFVIDRQESRNLFKSVREPSLNEVILTEFIGDPARWPAIWRWRLVDPPPFTFLSPEPTDTRDGQPDEKDEDHDSEPGGAPRPGLGNLAEHPRAEHAGGNGSRKPVEAPGHSPESGDI